MNYRFILNYIKNATIMEQPLIKMTRQIISILRPRLFIICVAEIKNDDNMVQLYFQAVR